MGIWEYLLPGVIAISFDTESVSLLFISYPSRKCFPRRVMRVVILFMPFSCQSHLGLFLTSSVFPWPRHHGGRERQSRKEREDELISMDPWAHTFYSEGNAHTDYSERADMSAICLPYTGWIVAWIECLYWFNKTQYLLIHGFIENTFFPLSITFDSPNSIKTLKHGREPTHLMRSTALKVALAHPWSGSLGLFTGISVERLSNANHTSPSSSRRPKAGVIWEKWLENSKVIKCNAISPIENWPYCTCQIRAQSFCALADLTSSVGFHLQVIIILVLSALILKWLI